MWLRPNVRYVSVFLTAALCGGDVPYAPTALPPTRERTHLRPDRCVGDWASCGASVDVVEGGVMCYGVGNRTLTPCCFTPYSHTVPTTHPVSSALTLQRGVTGTARMLHAVTHSSISRQVREQM